MARDLQAGQVLMGLRARPGSWTLRFLWPARPLPAAGGITAFEWIEMGQAIKKAGLEWASAVSFLAAGAFFTALRLYTIRKIWLLFA